MARDYRPACSLRMDLFRQTAPRVQNRRAAGLDRAIPILHFKRGASRSGAIVWGTGRAAWQKDRHYTIGGRLCRDPRSRRRAGANHLWHRQFRPVLHRQWRRLRRSPIERPNRQTGSQCVCSSSNRRSARRHRLWNWIRLLFPRRRRNSGIKRLRRPSREKQSQVQENKSLHGQDVVLRHLRRNRDVSKRRCRLAVEPLAQNGTSESNQPLSNGD